MKIEWKGSLKKLCSLYSQKETEYETKVKTRKGLLFLGIALLLIGEVGILYYNSGYQEGLNKHADLYKEAAITEGNVKSVVAGNVYDRNYTCLVENKIEGVVVKNEINGKVVEEEIRTRVSSYLDDFAYTQLIGFIDRQSVKMEDGEVKVVSGPKDYRLMQYYRDTLYQTMTKKSEKGNSLVLTLDHELQMKVAELLVKELEATKEEATLGLEKQGSAVVLNAKTGEVLAMVSVPSLNANMPNTSFKILNDTELEDLELRYPVSHKGSKVPGSIFKILTTVSLIDHGMENFTVEDEKFTVDSAEIVNDYPSNGEVIDYHQALVKSSNVFFAKAVLEMGGEALDETAKKFQLDKYTELDFGAIGQNWDLDISDDVNVAHTAFGQGKTLFSTMTAAMMTQAIANDGVMIEPHLIKEVIDEKGNKVEKIATTVNEVETHKVTSKSTANKVTDAMVAATQSYIAYGIEGKSAKEVYQTYSIASKTGTGENGDSEDTNNAWFISFAPAQNPEYVVVVNQCYTDKYGSRMMDTAAEIYRYLFE